MRLVRDVKESSRHCRCTAKRCMKVLKKMCEVHDYHVNNTVSASNWGYLFGEDFWLLISWFFWIFEMLLRYGSPNPEAQSYLHFSVWCLIIFTQLLPEFHSKQHKHILRRTPTYWASALWRSTRITYLQETNPILEHVLSKYYPSHSPRQPNSLHQSIPIWNHIWVSSRITRR